MSVELTVGRGACRHTVGRQAPHPQLLTARRTESTDIYCTGTVHCRLIFKYTDGAFLAYINPSHPLPGTSFRSEFSAGSKHRLKNTLAVCFLPPYCTCRAICVNVPLWRRWLPREVTRCRRIRSDAVPWPKVSRCRYAGARILARFGSRRIWHIRMEGGSSCVLTSNGSLRRSAHTAVGHR